MGLGAAMAGVALAAVCVKWPVLAAPAVLGAGAWAIGRTWGPKIELASWVVLAAVYGPTVQGFLLDCEHCRESWRWIAPVLPGGVAVEGFGVLTGWRVHRPPILYGLAAVATLLLLAGAVWLAARGRAWLVAAAAVCAAGSAFAAFAVSQVLRM